jgi:hypothetical protein
MVSVLWNPATEHLFVVLTREPLADVRLRKHSRVCAARTRTIALASAGRCLDAFSRRRKLVKVVTSNSSGQAQTERGSGDDRGLGLDQTAPQPSVIRMSASTGAPVLVTTLDLVHK